MESKDILMSGSSPNEDPGHKLALGLDLGISFCRFTIFRDNKFELIPNDDGHF
jgi:hypothetical protein